MTFCAQHDTKSVGRKQPALTFSVRQISISGERTDNVAKILTAPINRSGTKGVQ